MGLLWNNDSDNKAKIAELAKKEEELSKNEIDYSMRSNILSQKETALQNERDAFEKMRSEQMAMFKSENEKIAEQKSELEKRRQELIRLEAEAKSGFVEKQRESFKAVIEKRNAELDAREKQLRDLEASIAERMSKLHTLEGELAQRELKVTQSEQKAKAGYADIAHSMAEENRIQHEANVEKSKSLAKQQEELAARNLALEKKNAELTLREQKLLEAEQKRDAGYSDSRIALEKELMQKRQEAEQSNLQLKMQLKAELDEYRVQKMAELEDDIEIIRAERRESAEKADEEQRKQFQQDMENQRKTCMEELDKQKAQWKKELEKEQNQWNEEKKRQEELLKQQSLELERLKGVLNARESDLTSRESKMAQEERMMEKQAERNQQSWEDRNGKLDDEIEERVNLKCGSIKSSYETATKDNEKLRETIKSQDELLNAYENLKRQLGDREPEAVINELKEKTHVLAQLKKDLSTRPSDEIIEQFDEMKKRIEELKIENADLKNQREANAKDVADAKEYKRDNEALKKEIQRLNGRNDILEKTCNELQEQLNRNLYSFASQEERDARVAAIERPVFDFDKVYPMGNDKSDVEMSEYEWLEGIRANIEKYGLQFNKRILWSFHTSLKTAEWSPITVLAGVSGTGKSKLPKLYAYFGGMNFMMLSVQPNWDCQESMLGYFNSIDNVFDAKEVLRFLAQTQKDWEEPKMGDPGYPGLANYMNLVLLDEMNLAYPELYFAEFLSKLEDRRGLGAKSVPEILVKLGAKVDPYKLKLGRNVLWTGTMNQDETTHALSDKVLDRSIVIHFPRPTELKGLDKNNLLSKYAPSKPLNKKTWESWVKNDISFNKEILPYKKFLDEMNMRLAVAGRAIGHRVWQSVEYYMANYPDVIVAQKKEDKKALNAAMHKAFEDQIVQKVMPKLRGIDTRGTSYSDCLVPIKQLLNEGVKVSDGGKNQPFNLNEDFEKACELGYGQFIWQTANYLNKEKD